MKLKDFKLLETDVPKGVQAILEFSNYELSIVKNEASYGNKQGLFEIAVFKDGEQKELPGITNSGDTVKGWLTESDVDAIISKMYFLTGTTPRQI
jgi:hypothetical protein